MYFRAYEERGKASGTNRGKEILSFSRGTLKSSSFLSSAGLPRSRKIALCPRKSVIARAAVRMKVIGERIAAVAAEIFQRRKLKNDLAGRVQSARRSQAAFVARCCLISYETTEIARSIAPLRDARTLRPAR